MLDNVVAVLIAPEVCRVPVKRAGYRPENRCKFFDGCLQADVIQSSVPLMYALTPKIVVKLQIEQGTVHVQQNVVNLCPVYCWKNAVLPALNDHLMVGFSNVVEPNK